MRICIDDRNNGNRLCFSGVNEFAEVLRNSIADTCERVGLTSKCAEDVRDVVDDLVGLVGIMERHGIREIYCDRWDITVYDEWGEMMNIDEWVIVDISDYLVNIVWAVDCILSSDYVSDVNIVPIGYRVRLGRDVIEIVHFTVWDNA